MSLAIETGIKWTTRCILHTCPSREGGLLSFRFPPRTEGIRDLTGFMKTFHGAVQLQSVI